MGWGIAGLRGRVPNTSGTCAAIHHARASTPRAAHRHCHIALPTGGALPSQRHRDPTPDDLGNRTHEIVSPSRHPETQLQDPNSLSNAIAGLTRNVDSLSGDVNGLSGDVESLSGDVDALSGDVESLSGDVESLSGDIVALTNDLGGLSGTIFTLPSGISHQFHLSKPLTHRQLEPRHHPGLAPATLNPQTHPSYA